MDINENDIENADYSDLDKIIADELNAASEEEEATVEEDRIPVEDTISEEIVVEEAITEEISEVEESQEDILNKERADILDKAKEMGYDEDKFSKDHPRYVSPHEFVRYGQIRDDAAKAKNRVDEIAKETQEQLANYKNLMETRAAAKIKELESERQVADDNFDLEDYKKAQFQIDRLKEEQAMLTPSAAPQVHQEMDLHVAEWDQKNPWIYDITDPRSVQAKLALKEFYDANPAMAGAKDEGKFLVQYIDRKLGLDIPKVDTKTHAENPRRDVGNTEVGRSPKSVKNKGKLTMADLTGEEKREWEQTKHSVWNPLGNGKDKYLDAVKTSRSMG